MARISKRTVFGVLLSGLLVGLVSVRPGLATRMPPALTLVANHFFSDATVRLDGSIETRSGDIYLPVVPASTPTTDLKKVVVDTFPINAQVPDVVAFSNGWFYLRVVRRGVVNTVSLPESLPPAVKKMLLADKFPNDLIVPDNMRIPKSMKSMVGDVDIQVVDDALFAKPDFGEELAKSKSAATATAAVAAATPASPGQKTPAGGESVRKGEVFVTSPGTGKITLLDESTLDKVIDFPTDGTPTGMAYGNGKLYIADQSKARVMILDVKKKVFLTPIDMQPKSAPKGLAILPNGKLLYVSESAANDIAVVETDTDKVLERTHVPPGPGRMAISPNGFSLVVLNVPSGQATIFSTTNQRVVGAVSVGTMPNSVVISKDSNRAYVTNRMANSISIIDIPKRLVIGTIHTGSGPTGMALSADGSKLFVANAKDNLISVYDTSTRNKLQEVKLPLDVDFPGALTMMPDGKRIIVSSASTDAVGVFNSISLAFDHQPVIGHTSDEIIWAPAD
ncbi:MAG TPA: beta-propeller fold lactonase family protein [Planktothrix sp.]|jgi:YVTN family beta-propeller protein